MPELPIKLTGIQVARAIDRGGGVWGPRDISRAVAMDRQWAATARRDNDDWPRACSYRVRFHHAPENGLLPLFAGEDVIDWLEAHEHYGKAERMIEAVNVLRVRIRSDVASGPDS